MTHALVWVNVVSATGYALFAPAIAKSSKVLLHSIESLAPSLAEWNAWDQCLCRATRRPTTFKMTTRRRQVTLRLVP